MADNPNEKYGIPTNMNHQLIQQALQSQNTAAYQQQQAAMSAVDRIEGSMYDTLGSQQLQTEQDIKDRRIQALRSGVSSSGLAAQELQNIQTAQIGAQEVARQYDQQRAQLMMEGAGAEASNRAQMAQMINQNLGNIAAVEAQRLPHDWGQAIESSFGEGALEGMPSKERSALQAFMDPNIDNDTINQKDLKAALRRMDKTRGVGPQEEEEEETRPEEENEKIRLPHQGGMYGGYEG